MERQVDPVIEAYKKDIDRALLRQALALSPHERIVALIAMHKAANELRRAGERAEPARVR